MTTTQLLVSCIMPTADRPEFIPIAIARFLQQDYPNKELIIVDDGIKSMAHLIPDDPIIRYFYTEPLGTIGDKRNYACMKSCGEIIMHWDDDDWYAPDWISRQVNALSVSGAQISGLNTIIIFSTATNRKWIYEDLEGDKPWICGATFAYEKSLWERYHFSSLQVGEDYDFLCNSGAITYALDYPEGFMVTLHQGNTSIRPY